MFCIMNIEKYPNQKNSNIDQTIETNILSPYIKILKSIFWDNFDNIKKGKFDSQNQIIQNISSLLETDKVETYINDYLIKDFVKLKKEVQTKISKKNNQDDNISNDQIVDAVVYDSSIYKFFNKSFTEKLKQQIDLDSNLVSQAKNKDGFKQTINIQKQLNETQNVEKFLMSTEEQLRKTIKTKLLDIIRSKEITYKYYPGGWERRIDIK